jgi:yecA family protein
VFRASRSRSSRQPQTPLLLPPKLSEFGHRPFTSIEWQALACLLREPTWPRGTLSIYGLEGYLTALLVWPVVAQPGAWLPPIWNGESWRVRPPIDTVDRYGEFLELVVGFLRTIDSGLLQTPPRFDSGLHRKGARELPDLNARAQSWAEGFGRGLRQSVQSRGSPDQWTCEAVRHIGAFAASESRSASGSAQRAGIVLTDAVLALASTRISRGPLGALPKDTVVRKPVDSPLPLRQTVPPSSRAPVE